MHRVFVRGTGHGSDPLHVDPTDAAFFAHCPCGCRSTFEFPDPRCEAQLERLHALATLDAILAAAFNACGFGVGTGLPSHTA